MLAGVVVAALAAVPGTPDPVAPGGVPIVQLAWADDDLSPAEFFGGTDHRRTFQASALARLAPVVLVADYSTLDATPVGERIDELTLTAGGWRRWRWPWWTIDGALGGGARLRGEYGGNTIQREGHATFDDAYADSAYVEAREVGLVYASTVVALDLAPLRLEVAAPVAVTSAGELQAEAEARAALSLLGLTVWAGVREQERAGDAGSAPGEYTADFEDGQWVVAGLRWWALTARVQWRPDLDEDEMIGALAIVWP